MPKAKKATPQNIKKAKKKPEAAPAAAAPAPAADVKKPVDPAA